MPSIPGGLADISSTRPLIPAGVYPATITEMEFKKAGTGAQMFAMRTEIDNGTVKGSIYENIVVINKDGQRNEPGLRRLKNIIEQIFDEQTANDESFDTDELIGKQVEVEVTQRQGKDQDGEPVPENRIKRFAAA